MKNKLQHKLSLQKQVIIKLNDLENIQSFRSGGSCGTGNATKDTEYCF